MVKQLQKWFMVVIMAMITGATYAQETKVTFKFSSPNDFPEIPLCTDASHRSTSPYCRVGNGNIPADGLTKDGVTMYAFSDASVKTHLTSVGGGYLYSISGANYLQFVAPSGKNIKSIKFNAAGNAALGMNTSNNEKRFTTEACDGTQAANEAKIIAGTVVRSATADPGFFVSWEPTEPVHYFYYKFSGAAQYVSIDVVLVDGQGTGPAVKENKTFTLSGALNNENAAGNVTSFVNSFTMPVPEGTTLVGNAGDITLQTPMFTTPYKCQGVTVDGTTATLSFSNLLENQIEDGAYTLSIPADKLKYETETEIFKNEAYTATWTYAKPFVPTVDIKLDNNALTENLLVESASTVSLKFNKEYANIVARIDRMYMDEESEWMEESIESFGDWEKKADNITWTASFTRNPQIFLKDQIYKMVVKAWDGDVFDADWNPMPTAFEYTIQFNGNGEVPAINWTWTIDPANESTVETVSKVTLTFPNLQEVYIPMSYMGGGVGPLDFDPGFEGPSGMATEYAYLLDENNIEADPIVCTNAETDFDNPNSIIFTFDGVPAGTYSFQILVPVAAQNAIGEEELIDTDTYGYPATVFTTTKQAERVASIDINAACTDGEKYYSTFSASVPVYAGEDLEVYEIAVDAEGVMTLAAYDAYETIPANTGVLVASTEAGVHALNAAWDEGESKLGTDNCLRPYTEAMSADNNNYRLTMHEGTTIGFFWGAENGGVFDIAINRAYLAVPKTVTAKGLWFNGNTATGINTVNVENNSTIYNIAGQRVNNNAKGVVIMNGKKVIR